VGEIALGFAPRGGRSSLVAQHHRGPLVVQRPFFPEGPEVCHVYLLHPPGGLVGGDRLTVAIDVEDGAQALLTMPAATKVYRSAGPTAEIGQDLRVAAGATLEWLPQETILHDGAALDARTVVDLAPGARFAGLELYCFGLPARRERWSRGRCRQRLELWRAGRPLVVERGRYDGGAPVHDAPWGLRGEPVSGLLLASPAPAPEAVADVRTRAGALPPGDLASATVVADGDALACRYAGPSVERGRGFLREAWRIWRQAVVGRAATAPRIWAT
jgi:urease accessory protein